MILPDVTIRTWDNDEYIVTTRYQVVACGWIVLVHPGLRFDGASIPRLFWRVIGHPLQGLMLPAAVIHDALYLAQIPEIGRKTADRMFYELCQVNQVGKLKSWLAWRAVRLAGWMPWNRRTDAERSYHRQFVSVRKAG